MAKMFITGSARSPSNEEFKARVARLAEMPAHTASPVAARRNKPPKSSFTQPPLKPSSDGAAEEMD
ncbi:hypothetical protein [Methylobacterium frigidaeris]|uniref:Uncharacterized protein n=1 Tax=Methylobacterium frigidaeris TaxID=2038277 RepID=A0AA37M7R9_9HYPH|nr:hypothetical protein [Methylobacterium frigidaeris]PIK71639.1 hypothetical protein CS379_18240 [Methylobacterium frigidaeris]GJD65021.1 hypothetical protein MPEAHAMD_5207 [Methylobacterium frigidaeris]